MVPVMGMVMYGTCDGDRVCWGGEMGFCGPWGLILTQSKWICNGYSWGGEQLKWFDSNVNADGVMGREQYVYV
jgi:hypothetical protein